MRKILLLLVASVLVTSAWAQYRTPQLQQHLRQQYPSLSLQDVEGMMITDQYTDAGTGVVHVYLRQTVNGIEVFNGNAALHFASNGALISHSSSFVSNAHNAIQISKPVIGLASALLSAGSEVDINVQTALGKADIPLVNNAAVITDAAVSQEPIKTKLVYLSNSKGQLVLTYNVVLYNNTTNDWWNIRVDAMNGAVVEKNNWTTHCEVAPGMFATEASQVLAQQNNMLSANGFGKKSASGTYLVVPYPTESPIHGPRQYVSGSIAKSNASPYGWHDTDGVVGEEYTVTRGNNVFADEDTLAFNFSGWSPDGGDSLVFDFPMDSNWIDYGYYMPASITNLFYANNFMHDVMYQYGFNEVAGNFQYNNYGKGGSGKDQVQAEAQDGNGSGNANFSTPDDGSSGRMQMYLWPVTPVAQPQISISSPTLTGSYTAPLSKFGSKRFGDITARVILVTDSTSADSLGCGVLKNTDELAGNIALIYRGTCTNSAKVLNAQNAGAIAVIMINNTSLAPNAMNGTDASVIIPSVILSQSIGAQLRAAVENGDTVLATIKGIPVVKAFDSDFDNGVIAHEYGHGISNRLTGGPANSNCLMNNEQPGEGWSDFFALALTAKPGDSGTFARGIGTFVYNQTPTSLGIRDYKYSTNMTVNPMTYGYIRNDRGVHYVGTVWCSMLWDMYWNLVDKYGFDADVYNGTGGNNKAIQLVIDGLKLQPCSPGFVDARDAILKADSIRYGGANRNLIWKTFARRGLGLSATQGSSDNVMDGVLKFDIPPTTGLSAAENLGYMIELSPNPSQGLVTIVMPDQLKEAQVTVYDIAGKVVFNQMMSTDILQHISLDLTGNQQGVYFVKVNNGGTTFNSKLLLTN